MFEIWSPLVQADDVLRVLLGFLPLVVRLAIVAVIAAAGYAVVRETSLSPVATALVLVALSFLAASVLNVDFVAWALAILATVVVYFGFRFVVAFERIADAVERVADEQ